MRYRIRENWAYGWEVYDSENLHRQALYVSSKGCCEAVAEELNNGDFSSLSPRG
jgi:hypothetical protein